MVETCLFCKEAEFKLPELSWAPRIVDYLKNKPLPSLDTLIDSWSEQTKSYQAEINLPYIPPLVLSCEFAYTALEDFETLVYLKNKFVDYDVNFVIYLRRVDKHCNSDLLQTLKYGDWSNVDEFRQIKKDRRHDICNLHLDLPNILGTMGAVFGNKKIIVRPFEKSSLYKSDVVADFLRIIGVELPQSYEDTQQNVTAPYDFLIHYVNKFGNPIKRSAPVSQLFEKILSERELLEMHTDGSKYAYSPKERSEMIAYVGGSYKTIMNKFFMVDSCSLDSQVQENTNWVNLSNLDPERIKLFDKIIDKVSETI
ncbi:hypothetical protein [Synechococcus sp. RS9902]|uniref:hypothetical protein n=1 Tax=Synechococcus sp. RS9902 TaxID=221345 RepID=UPI0016461D73|nr:hypothetical protein [Synechococcus sp. RS9902]